MGQFSMTDKDVPFGTPAGSAAKLPAGSEAKLPAGSAVRLAAMA